MKDNEEEIYFLKLSILFTTNMEQKVITDFTVNHLPEKLV